MRTFQFGIVEQVDGSSACLGPIFFAFVKNAIASRNFGRAWCAWLRHNCCSLNTVLVGSGTNVTVEAKVQKCERDLRFVKVTSHHKTLPNAHAGKNVTDAFRAFVKDENCGRLRCYNTGWTWCFWRGTMFPSKSYVFNFSLLSDVF
jgi:hypothetical protein